MNTQPNQIPIKTPEEIATMREGGKILAECLKLTAEKALPGTSTIELDQFAEEFIRNHDATPSFKGYHNYPATLCTNINEQVVHAIPSPNQILKEGDIIAIDCGCYYKGFHTDSTVLLGVGPEDQLSSEKARLIQAAEKVLSKAENFLKDGVYLNDLCELIGRTITKKGYSVVEELTGHGIGLRLHEPPHIPNQKESHGKGPLLKAGMTLAIEPIFTAGSGRIKTLNDKWTIVTADNSLAVQIEHTFLITVTGCEVLTRRL
jgi:methionyl aminopeptidase